MAKKRINICIDEDLHRSAKLMAIIEGSDFSALITKLLAAEVGRSETMKDVMGSVRRKAPSLSSHARKVVTSLVVGPDPVDAKPGVSRADGDGSMPLSSGAPKPGKTRRAPTTTTF